MLHVTNGDSTVALLERAGVGGEVIAWRDVLHEGPVPALAPAELRAVRARFLAEHDPAGEDWVEADLRARDERLERALADGEPVVLWFEHDLYDQLQLAQILAGLSDRPSRAELICIGSFPGRPGFAGLGELTPDELASLWPLRTPLTAGHVHAGRAAWDAFRGDDPRAWARQAVSADHLLPYLAPALRRALEELPGLTDGLSRTERQLLKAVARGAATRTVAFKQTCAAEEAPFLGDVWAFARLDELARGAQPLLDGGGALRLTGAGEAVLAGRADRVELIGFDRWLGGVHLRAGDGLWRWDAESGEPHSAVRNR